MLMTIRVVRAIIGVVALVMFKASVQPGFQFILEGDAPSLPTFAWRLGAGVCALAAFFYLRASINAAYVARGKGPGPLRGKLHL